MWSIMNVFGSKFGRLSTLMHTSQWTKSQAPTLLAFAPPSTPPPPPKPEAWPYAPVEFTVGHPAILTSHPNSCPSFRGIFFPH